MNKDGLIFTELEGSNINQDVLQKFDCGHPDFNDFLREDAKQNSCEGKGVTYILVDKNEYQQQNITTVFAFATIQSTSLHYYDIIENNQVLCNIPGLEIKYFAISKFFQKQTIGNSKEYYSTAFFEILLVDLYEMSTKIVGFQAVFLRANSAGEKLYKRKNFIDTTQYIIPYEEDDPLGKCKPMVLMIQDNIYSIFGF